MTLSDNSSVIFGTVNLHTHGLQLVSVLPPCLGSTNRLQITPDGLHIQLNYLYAVAHVRHN